MMGGAEAAAAAAKRWEVVALRMAPMAFLTALCPNSTKMIEFLSLTSYLFHPCRFCAYRTIY
jgi:hypothetical protein